MLAPFQFTCDGLPCTAASLTKWLSWPSIGQGRALTPDTSSDWWVDQWQVKTFFWLAEGRVSNLNLHFTCLKGRGGGAQQLSKICLGVCVCSCVCACFWLTGWSLFLCLFNFMHCKGEELRAPQTFVSEGQGLGRWARRGLTKLEENTRSLVGIFRSIKQKMSITSGNRR